VRDVVSLHKAIPTLVKEFLTSQAKRYARLILGSVEIRGAGLLPARFQINISIFINCVCGGNRDIVIIV
jgi:hypothetical protein